MTMEMIDEGGVCRSEADEGQMTGPADSWVDLRASMDVYSSYTLSCDTDETAGARDMALTLIISAARDLHTAAPHTLIHRGARVWLEHPQAEFSRDENGQLQGINFATCCALIWGTRVTPERIAQAILKRPDLVAELKMPPPRYQIPVKPTRRKGVFVQKQKRQFRFTRVLSENSLKYQYQLDLIYPD